MVCRWKKKTLNKKGAVVKSGLSFLLACGLIGIASPCVWASDIEAEKERLQGTWVSVSFEAVGSEKNSHTATLEFKDDSVKLTVDGKSQTYTYELDDETEPKRMDFLKIQATQVVLANYGLYSLAGDTLTICHGGPVRPTKLALREVPNSLDSLVVLKRKR